MSYTVQLPLALATNSTYVLIDDLKKFVKQNVKNVLLTNPGERIMIPEFGVGLKSYLFESPVPETTVERIRTAITAQFEKFLPTVGLTDIIIAQEEHLLKVKVFYVLTNFNLEDFLEIAVIN
mgnify:CR=1 FL=1